MYATVNLWNLKPSSRHRLVGPAPRPLLDHPQGDHHRSELMLWHMNSGCRRPRDSRRPVSFTQASHVCTDPSMLPNTSCTGKLTTCLPRSCPRLARAFCRPHLRLAKSASSTYVLPPLGLPLCIRNLAMRPAKYDVPLVRGCVSHDWPRRLRPYLRGAMFTHFAIADVPTTTQHWWMTELLALYPSRSAPRRALPRADRWCGTQCSRS